MKGHKSHFGQVLVPEVHMGLVSEAWKCKPPLLKDQRRWVSESLVIALWKRFLGFVLLLQKIPALHKVTKRV